MYICINVYILYMYMYYSIWDTRPVGDSFPFCLPSRWFFGRVSTRFPMIMPSIPITIGLLLPFFCCWNLQSLLLLPFLSKFTPSFWLMSKQPFALLPWFNLIHLLISPENKWSSPPQGEKQIQTFDFRPFRKLRSDHISFPICSMYGFTNIVVIFLD